MDFEVFAEKYKPIPSQVPTFYEVDGKTYAWVTTTMTHAPQLGPKHMWSIIEAEDDLIIVPGVHAVNVMGYMLTEQPWSDEDYKNDLEIR